LVVEDEPEILQLLQAYFEAKGLEVYTAADGVEGLERFREVDPDLMILDVVMPRLDGWAVLEAVRSQSSIPVILLTALEGTEEAVKGLTMGADDYLRKPFEIRELDARIGAVLRRLETSGEGLVLKAGPIEIDDRTKQVLVGREAVALSPKEYELLKLLAQDPGRVFSSEEILARVWTDSHRANASDVKQYIHLLRNKLKRHSPDAARIENIKGFGYTLSA
jgi:DNA-binding response OmpR family regulator